jgi:hypothetical protein
LTPLLRILLALLVAAAATVPIPSGLTGPRKTRRISSILRRRTRPELHLRHA